MKGQNVGYIRVSSAGQNAARQLDGVELDRLFEEVASGKGRGERPALAEALLYCREGDTLHVHSMDRLARNLVDLRQIVEQMTGKGVAIRFHKENLTFTGGDSPMANLLLSVMGAFAEFERALIKERQREGITQAKIRGVYTGRRPALSEAQIAQMKERVGRGESKTALAKELGISRSGLYNYLGQK